MSQLIILSKFSSLVILSQLISSTNQTKTILINWGKANKQIIFERKEKNLPTPHTPQTSWNAPLLFLLSGWSFTLNLFSDVQGSEYFDLKYIVKIYDIIIKG